MNAGGALRLRLAVAIVSTLSPAAQAELSLCEQAGSAAERQYGLPADLLLAIGRVESGRWDAAYGRTVPWPWAIDAAGNSRIVASKQEAVDQTRALSDAGLRNVDVGCFQINLRSHPTAFADLDQAFDPTANAQYAAQFLASLHTRLGTWEAAVAAYHSSNPERGNPYQQAVYARWSSPDTGNPQPRTLQPMMVYAIDGVQISVWTPSHTGAAASPVVLAQGPASATDLPRVITPGR